MLPAGRRRAQLEEAVAGMFQENFAGRLLPFDGAAAHAYTPVAPERRLAGRPLSQCNAQIAAICRSRDAVLEAGNG